MKNILLLAVAAALISPPLALAQWSPPVGIPNPSFGIVEDAPPSPRVWNKPIAGYYYVDETAAAATDSSNSYGTPSRPRRTIPLALSAGAVVELHGTYSYHHGSPRGIVSSGTASAPVFIRGRGPSDKPRVTSCWEMFGSYYVVEHIEFAECGSIVFLAPTDHAALRHSDAHGTTDSGGLGVASWNGLTTSDVVLWDNLIHDNGDVNADYDQDRHGVAVGANVHHLWVVDNELYRNSGDGIQINAGSAAMQANTHHIFVGRNTAHHNKQNGFWTKQANDVIFSQNVSYSHRPGNSSSGVCMGGQYAPGHVWFINNVMWDCDFGIQLASDSGQGTGSLSFFIGNVITRIHDSDNDFQPGSAWQNCGISLPGGVYRYVLENSLYDVDSGVCTPYDTGTVYFFDNLIEQVRANGYHVTFDSPALAYRTVSGSNLFAPNFRFGLGGDDTTVGAKPLGSVGSNSVVSRIGWTNPSAGDFSLQPQSPALGYGFMKQAGIWEYYRYRYGVLLSVDLNGVRRDTASSVEAGATQY